MPASPGGMLVRSGAELVLLTEELYVRLLRVALWLGIAGAGLSSIYALIQTRDLHHGETVILAAGWALLALWSLRHTATVYLWLRRAPWHRLTPGLAAGVLLLIDGPHGPLWFAALGGLFATAAVSTITTTAIISFAATGLYAAGTIVRGYALVPPGNVSYLAAALGLPAVAIVAAIIVEWFARFTARLHHHEHLLRPPEPPLRVHATVTEPRGLLPPGPKTPGRRPRRRGGIVTARQLEVLALIADGLKQEQAAACLGISVGQIQRHVAEAKARTDCQTTGQLIATLIRAGILPASQVA